MKKGQATTALVANLVLAIFCIVSIIPMILTISISLTDVNAIHQSGYQIVPSKFSLDAYVWLFKYPATILTGYKNSLIITGAGTVVNLLVTALVAYPLSRRDFRYRGFISAFLFFTMIFSGGLAPTYLLIVQYLHWKNMLISIIVPAIAAPFNVFLMRVLFQDIPPALTEAAKIDGSSDLNSFFKIILPLSKPALATVGLMIALGYWNDAFSPILYLDTQDKYPITLVLNNIVNLVNEIKQHNSIGLTLNPNAVPSDTIIFAMMVVATLPMVFLFTFLQKYFVKGMALGAVKG